MRKWLATLALFLAIGAARAADDTDVLGGIGKVPYPDAFWSTPVSSASFGIIKSITENGVIKTFRGANEPSVMERAYDPRLKGNAKYYETVTREINNWSFTAVRTIDASGMDRSTVNISGFSTNKWNPFRPRDGVLLSRSGFEVDFKAANQILFTYVTGANYTGNLNRCGESGDNIVIRPFDIQNNIFEAFDSIIIRSKPEAYYGC